MHSSYKKVTRTKIAKARKRPGSSNAYSYNKDNVFAGPAGGSEPGTFPLTKDGSKKLDMGRVASAQKLAHNAPEPKKLKKYIARQLLSKGNTMQKSLGKKILERLGATPKKKDSTFGGNKGDISRSAPVDYADSKDTDPNYRSKAYGGGAGEQRRSAPRDYSKRRRPGK
jgi:hypothetical protein